MGIFDLYFCRWYFENKNLHESFTAIGIGILKGGMKWEFYFTSYFTIYKLKLPESPIISMK